MRKMILAAVALSPMLLHAQANSPAQPQPAVQNAALISKMTAPAMPGATADVPTKIALPVSTGVTFPKLIQSAAVQETNAWQWRADETAKTAVVSFVVDANGTPQNLHIVRSVGASMDQDVLASVSQYRFVPGTLDHSAIPVEMQLTVNILSRTK